jgi:hypothetical protein
VFKFGFCIAGAYRKPDALLGFKLLRGHAICKINSVFSAVCSQYSLQAADCGSTNEIFESDAAHPTGMT